LLSSFNHPSWDKGQGPGIFEQGMHKEFISESTGVGFAKESRSEGIKKSGDASEG